MYDEYLFVMLKCLPRFLADTVTTQSIKQKVGFLVSLPIIVLHMQCTGPPVHYHKLSCFLPLLKQFGHIAAKSPGKVAKKIKEKMNHSARNAESESSFQTTNANCCTLTGKMHIDAKTTVALRLHKPSKSPRILKIKHTLK